MVKQGGKIGRALPPETGGTGKTQQSGYKLALDAIGTTALVLNGMGMKAILGLAVLAAGPAFGEGLNLSGGGKGSSSFAAKTALLDGRLSEQYEYSVRLTPTYDPEAGGEETPAVRYKGSYKGEYLAVAKAAAQRHDVPEEMFLKLVQQESGWNPGAVSPKGATGLAQLMPGTAAKLGVDINDPQENLEGGARYLRMMYDRFGSWRLALAAYNAGPAAVEKHGGIPPYAETKNYVIAILG